MPIGQHLPGLALLTLTANLPAVGANQRWDHYSDYHRVSVAADGGRHLWLGTPGGLIRVDKTTLDRTYFNRANSALFDVRISALDADTGGRVAAITDGGDLVEYDGAAWTNLGGVAPFDNHRPFTAAWGPGGRLWVLAADVTSRIPSLFSRRAGRWERLALEGASGFHELQTNVWPYSYGTYAPIPVSLQVDEAGRAWVTAYAGIRPLLFRVDPGGRVDTAAVPSQYSPMTFIVPRTGSPFWLCQEALVTESANGWEVETNPDPVAKSLRFPHPRHLHARDADGTPLLSTYRLYRRRDTGWAMESLPGDSIPADPYFTTPLLLLEPEGSSTAAHGWPRLFAIRGERLGVLTGDGWKFSSVAATPLGIHAFHTALPRRGRPRDMVLATFSGLQSFQGDSLSFQRLAEDTTWGNLSLGSLGEDRQGRIWLSGKGRLVRQGPGSLEKVPIPDAPWRGFLKGGTTSDQAGSLFLAEDGAGNPWVADSSRMVAFPGSGSGPGTSHWLPRPWNDSALIRAIAGCPDGSIWVAAQARFPDPMAIAARHDGSGWSRLDTLVSRSTPFEVLRDLRCDGAGNVWVTWGKAMFQWDGKDWARHDAAATPWLAPGILAMAVDGEGRLWAATNRPARLLHWDNGWREALRPWERLGNIQVNAMAFDGSGRLWMATYWDGVLILDPGIPAGLARPPEAPFAGSRRARNAGSSWRIHSGPLHGTVSPDARVLDVRGREVTRGAGSRPGPYGAWISSMSRP